MRRTLGLATIAAAGARAVVMASAPAAFAATTAKSAVPVVVTVAATVVTGTTATMNGTVNPGSLATEAWFQWGPDSGYGQETAEVAVPAGTAAVKVAIKITGLTAGTSYTFQMAATNAKGSAWAAPLAFTTTAAVTPVTPLSNSGSAGNVILTFDDGPDIYDTALLAQLQALHLHAIFFVIGDKINASTDAIIRAEVADGDLVENHTWDHADWTGASAGTPALTDAQVTAELTETQTAIENAGAPAPTMARAPFGDLTGQYAVDAANLGLQMVQPFEVNVAYAPRIVDSMDWTGISAAQIVTDVTQGSSSDGTFYPGINGGSIIGFHDAAPGSCTAPSAENAPLCADALQTIASLQGIVNFMNANHLGNSVTVPADATGGILGPPPWNWLPTP